MTTTRTEHARRGFRAVASSVLGLAAVAMWLVGTPAAGASGGTTLIGTFALTPGSCAGGAASGTYLRMILPSGSPSGPYMSNSDSRCGDQSYTPLNPGTQGGLISGSYQPQPSPPFDAKGDALAGAITAPAQFYGTSFATSANKVDPQTHRSVSAPSVTATGSTLHADLRGFAVTWNGQYFNQGSPKPDGSFPGNTRPATGTYNASTGAFTLTWTSQVVGGPFDKFTGQWHLQGVFHVAGRANTPPVTSHGSTSGPAGASGTAASQVVVVPGAPAASTSHTPASAGASTTVSTVPLPAASGQNASPVALSTSTHTKTTWHVSGWLLSLLIGVAVLGFAALWRLNRLTRTGTPS